MARANTPPKTDDMDSEDLDLDLDLEFFDITKHKSREPRPTEGDPEVDEEQAPSTGTTGALDSFLAEMFQDTTQSDTGELGEPNQSQTQTQTSLGFLKANFKTKSAAIRYLHSLGWETKRISKHLGLRYQQVRNVLTTALKRGPNEDFHLQPDEDGPGTKSSQF